MTRGAIQLRFKPPDVPPLLSSTIVIVFSMELQVAIFVALSAYLGAYAFFVCAALVISVILVLAEFTYRLIEVPGINLGRQLITQGRKV
jgi:peptidoglycan/LPS O-acetylase OafA/YrhL